MDIEQWKKEKCEIEFNNSEASFIVYAANQSFLEAENALSAKLPLSDIERKHYQYQKNMALQIIKKLDKYI